MTAPIRVHIERLVVDGLPMDRAGSARFQAALRETLGALLRADAPASGASERVVQAAPVAAEASPTALGEAVAISLHASLFPKAVP